MTASLRIKNGFYYAVLSYKEKNKYKQKWISLGLPIKNNKRKAEEKLAEVVKDVGDKYESTSGSTKFTTYLERWLADKKSTVELSTWEGYKIYAEKHIIPYFSGLDLSIRDITASHIKEYYKYQYDSGRCDGTGGLSIPSIKKHATVLIDAFNDAIPKYISYNPAKGVKMPAKSRATRPPHFATVSEANKILEALTGHPIKEMVFVVLYYGLRRSEALGLKWSAIDFEHDTLTINHTVVKNLTVEMKDRTKSESSTHTYKLLPDVKEMLLSLRQRQERDKQQFGGDYIYNDYVFKWPNGKLFRPDYVTRSFERALKNAGLPKMTFHDLRHSTASILFDKGWEMKDMQMWLRHSSIDVTFDTYTHISTDRKSRLTNDLNATFTPVAENT